MKLSSALVLDARLTQSAATRPLSECLKSPGSAEGQKRLAEHLRNRPFPHFEPHPSRRNLLIRTDADGTRTAGRFVNRQFRPNAKGEHE